MLLPQKFVVDLDGCIQIDLSYAIIPATASGMVRLYREVEGRYHMKVSMMLENAGQFVSQEHSPHFESEICHFFHHLSSRPSRKRRRLQIDRDMQHNDEQSHRPKRVKL